jgi:hypothetical protein
MIDVTENDLRGIIKALTDVVSPSIDPSDPLAQEQMRLVVEYLEFLRARFAFLPERERYDLGQEIALARGLAGCVPAADPFAAALAKALEEGEKAYAATGTPIAETRHWAAVLAAIVREIVRASQHWPADARRRVELTVLDMSADRVEFERAWFSPMRLDPSPSEIRPLEGFFDRPQRAG